MTGCELKYQLRKRIGLLPISFLLLLLFSQVVHAEKDSIDLFTEDDKKVLFISSYSYSYGIVEDQLDGIRDRFRDEWILLDVEFMNSKNFGESKNYNNFYLDLKYRLDKGMSYDAVIVGDDNGLRFVMEHKEVLWPDTPIFFMGINDLNLALDSSKDPLVTGVYEDESIHETIVFAADLNPLAERLVCIIDDTTSSQLQFNEVMSYESSFNQLDFTSINMSEVSHSDFFNSITKLDHKDIVLYLTAVRDKDNNFMHTVEVCQLMDDALDIPIFSLNSNGIGDGIFGGKLLDHHSQGYEAAAMAVKYFNGIDATDIPFSRESPNYYTVDYPQLDDFGYDEDDLPEGTVLINRKYTFWEQYGLYMLLILLGFVAETLIVIALIINVRSKHKKEQDLLFSRQETEKLNKRLEASMDDMQAVNRELEESIKDVNERDYQIQKMIHYDDLTGLLTKYALFEYINDEIEKDDSRLALIHIDIDNFRNINDAFGHSYGDRVIKEVAKALGGQCSTKAEIARFSSDEFFIATKAFSSLSDLEKMITMNRQHLKNTLEKEIKGLHITVSCGAAVYPDNGSTAEELMKCTDIALNEAKKLGKDTFVIYNSRIDRNLQDKITFQNYIRQGFDREEFNMNYQPLVDAKTRKAIGFEALIRWHNKDLGWVSPMRLITEAEEMGTIIALGNWIFRQGAVFVKEMNKKSNESRYVSINVSAIQIAYQGFYRYVIEIVEDLQIDPAMICIEMTETALIEDLDIAVTVIQKFSDYGFKIALDDFGTGYSSLNYLRNLPIDILKIDKTFIDDIINSNYDKYLVEAVIKIAREKQITVVAEGVESKAQLVVLEEMGCSVIQGYLFSKPVSHEAAIDLSQIIFN